jgi:competence protein ComEA
MTIKQKIKKLGYKIKIVPHEVIKDYIACYNVKYREKIVYPKVAKKLNIPLNEIWISERYKKKMDKILSHELREIKYRYMGYNERKAHKKASENKKQK